MSGKRGSIGRPDDPVIGWLYDYLDENPRMREGVYKFVNRLNNDRRDLLRIHDVKFRKRMAVLVREAAHRDVGRFGKGDTWPDTPLEQRLHNLVARNFRMVYESSGPSRKQKSADGAGASA